MPCPYSTLLGIPGQGFHATRIGPYALNDTLATILGAILLAWIYKTSFLAAFIGFFVLGEVLHYLFGVQSAFLTTLGISVGCSSA
jgi:hypothetical protein